jgi:hypothetical protein
MAMCGFVGRVKLAQDKVNKRERISGSADRISVLKKISAVWSQMLAEFWNARSFCPHSSTNFMTSCLNTKGNTVNYVSY